MGNAITKTPHIQHTDPITFPSGVVGQMSPYPTVCLLDSHQLFNTENCELAQHVFLSDVSRHQVFFVRFHEHVPCSVAQFNSKIDIVLKEDQGQRCRMEIFLNELQSSEFSANSHHKRKMASYRNTSSLEITNKQLLQVSMSRLHENPLLIPTQILLN